MALERSDAAWWVPLTDFGQFGWARACRGTAPEMSREYVAVRLALEAAQSQLAETIAEHTEQAVALAASQESERELRELLLRSHGYLSMPEWCKVNIDPDATGEAQRFHDVCADIQHALSRAPGSTAALRAVLVDVALDAWINGAVNYRSEGSGVEVTAPSREYIEREFVARVLDRSDTTEGGR